MEILAPFHAIWSWFFALESNTKATWIIAAAALANLFVYYRMSTQTRQQIQLANKQLELFSEMNRPRISAVVTGASRIPMDDRLFVQIKIHNYGNTTASRLVLHYSLSGKGGDFGATCAERVLQPDEEALERLPIDLPKSAYEVEEFLKSYIDCTYFGLGGQRYSFRQNYRYDCKDNSFMAALARST